MLRMYLTSKKNSSTKSCFSKNQLGQRITMSQQTVTRAYIAEQVYREVGLTYSESSDMVDAVLEEIIQSLVSGNQVKLSSFGTFAVRDKPQRIGRNPKTKEEAIISPRKVVSFHASNILKQQINGEVANHTITEEKVDSSGEGNIF